MSKNGATTFVDRVMSFFRAHPNQWLDATQFENVGGRQAWRSRIADARRAFVRGNEGTIENRVARVKTADGRRYTRSQYRFVPHDKQILGSPHDLNEWSLRR